jgi:hypothetical protein
MTMKKKFATAIIGALLVALFAGVMVLLVQGHWLPFIESEGPVSEEQVRAKLAADGWSDVNVTRRGDLYNATGKRYGQLIWVTVDSKTGRRMYDDDVSY